MPSPPRRMPPPMPDSPATPRILAVGGAKGGAGSTLLATGIAVNV